MKWYIVGYKAAQECYTIYTTLCFTTHFVVCNKKIFTNFYSHCYQKWKFNAYNTLGENKSFFLAFSNLLFFKKFSFWCVQIICQFSIRSHNFLRISATAESHRKTENNQRPFSQLLNPLNVFFLFLIRQSGLFNASFFFSLSGAKNIREKC